MSDKAQAYRKAASAPAPLTEALASRLRRLLGRAGPEPTPEVPVVQGGQVSRDAAIWAIRLFLGREARDEAEITLHRSHNSLESLRTGFAQTVEFASFLRQIDAAEGYRLPLFLLQPPEDPAIPAAFAPPSLATPQSQLCTGGQLQEPAYALWCRALDLVPNQHRKTWEFCYIAAVLDAAGALREGRRALGFGVGREPLPAFLARRGVSVTATDAPPDVIESQGWATTNQHAEGIEALERPNLVASETLRRLVSFRAVDMNAIPADLTGFDICWSACALEHLGSIRNGLQFIEASLETLRPGGIAVHTTEFNLSSNRETIEVPDLCLFRKVDIESLCSRLVAAGHQILPLNLHPGHLPVDEHIDLPPFGLPHLKVQVARYVTTSIGLVIRKRG